MLSELHIKNMGVLSTADVIFKPGLTVLTGETGSGKSLLLNSLGLLMGKRSDAGLIRHGCPQLEVQGIWVPGNNKDIEKLVEDAGGELEDDELYMARTVNSDGKSRASFAGKLTPASTLQAAGELLVTIHGQSDQIKLRNPETQREALDRYAGDVLRTALEDYQTTYREYRAVQKRVKELQTNAVQLERETVELARVIDEISKANPELGEDELLDQELKVLANVELLRSNAEQATVLLSDETLETGDPVTRIAQMVKLLENSAPLDPKAEVLLTQALTVQDALNVLTSELHSYLDGIDVDSLTRLAEVEERIATLDQLKKRYGPTLEDVVEYWKKSEQRLYEINPESNSLETLQQQQDELKALLVSKAKTVTDIRTTAAKQLVEEVNSELVGLAMAGNTLVVTLKPVTPYTIWGADEVSFKLQTPGGGDPKPIEKAASGGELSRIQLALAVVLLDRSVNTVVFDEIDSGLGGTTGLEVGKRLAKLAKDVQVIVVSHLGQVAAFGDHHLVVQKTVDHDNGNHTSVEVVEGEQRVNEITRMLAGLTTSETGKAHALELLQEAKQYKETL